MQNKSKDIGDLYKRSLQDLEVNEGGMEWDDLELKLEKGRFFRFNVTYFNVYYASLIALTFLISSAVYVDHFFISKNTSEPRERLEAQKVTNGKEQQQDSLQEFAPDKKTGVNSTLIRPKEVDRNEGYVQASVPDTSLKAAAPVDSTQGKESPLIQPEKKQAEVPPSKTHTPEKNKVVYITKQDTLYLVDSVKADKPRKKIKK